MATNACHGLFAEFRVVTADLKRTANHSPPIGGSASKSMGHLPQMSMKLLTDAETLGA